MKANPRAGVQPPTAGLAGCAQRRSGGGGRLAAGLTAWGKEEERAGGGGGVSHPEEGAGAGGDTCALPAAAAAAVLSFPGTGNLRDRAATAASPSAPHSARLPHPPLLPASCLEHCRLSAELPYPPPGGKL